MHRLHATSSWERTASERAFARALRAVLALILTGVLTGVAPGEAGAVTRIHVRGRARVEAQTSRDHGDLIVSGALVDDAGEALPNEAVALSLTREAEPGQVVSLGEDGSAARSCAGSGRASGATRPTTAGGHAVLVTDETGHFCVRATVPRDQYVVTLAWGGTALVEGAKLDLPVDTGRAALALRFDPEPRVIDLDRGPLALEVVASYDEDQTTHAAAGLFVQVTNERGDPLGAGATDDAGIFRLTVAADSLGPPGRGELRASFSGNGDLTKSVHTTRIERRARVRVELATPLDPNKALSPDDGIPLAIVARSKAGAIPTGSIEARVAGTTGDAVVGAAPLDGDGAARLVVTFGLTDNARDGTRGGTRDGTRHAELRLRFLSNAPWFEPGDDAIVRFPVKGPSPLRQAPLVVAGLAVVAWLILGRVKRSAPASIAAPSPKPAAVEGEARVEIVRSSRDPRAGWSGRVVDAHDGTPISAAKVRIERPGFERATVIASSFANDAGRFELHPQTHEDETNGFDELVIEGPLHAELRQPLPPSGELEIALILRKRRLLERLVTWARRRGRPFDASPEPTPGHIRRAAGDDFGTARWADAVERAAYGGGDVDARAEAEIDRLAPIQRLDLADEMRTQDPVQTVLDVRARIDAPSEANPAPATAENHRD